MFSGKLKELSLPEALKLIAEGKKTGVLSVRILDESSSSFDRHYISVQDGIVTGYFSSLDGCDLMNWLSIQSQFLSTEQGKSLLRLAYNFKGHRNLGEYLTTSNLLNPGQITAIFNQKVVEPICRLFAENNGVFIFNQRTTVAPTELTGLNISVPTLILEGLHQLEAWAGYSAKLPEAQVALLKASSVGMSQYALLTAIETQLLDTANGCRSLSELAKQWNVEIAVLQKAAFCLITAGLVEELPVANTTALAQEPVRLPLKTAPVSTPEVPKSLPQVPDFVPANLAVRAIANPTPAPAIAMQAGTSIPASSTTSAGAPLSNAFLEKFSTFFNNRLATASTVSAQG